MSTRRAHRHASRRAHVGPVNGYGVPKQRMRRGWFYTGSGFAMLPNAALTPTGHMDERNIGPATGEVYYNLLTEHWADRDPGPDNRYRCFMLDPAGVWRGMLIQLCRSAKMQDEGFILVGEAIAGGDDTARFGAVWFGRLDYDRAPWWVWDEEDEKYDRLLGYNTKWTGHWRDQPVYFGVNRSLARQPGDDGKRSYPYLYAPRAAPLTNPGAGENMKLGDIYRFILKGATPVAQDPSVYRKVGAAWNYATGRLPTNNWDRFGRVTRFQR